MNEKKNKKENVDKYGVSFDSGYYLDRMKVASNTDHTGIVPVAMDNEDDEESYEAMFNVPVGDMNSKKERAQNLDRPKSDAKK